MAERTFRAEIEIAAPASRVWSVLVDLDRYPRWNPFTVSMRSSLRVGEPIDMRVRMSRWRMTLSQRETVRDVSPPDGTRPGRLVWGMEMPGVRAERVQKVEALDADRCRYVTEDGIRGPLAALVFVMFGGSLEDGFEGAARGLAAEVAARYGAGDGGGHEPSGPGPA